jgi:hypothetical protein
VRGWKNPQTVLTVYQRPDMALHEITAFNGRGGIRTHGTLLTYTHFPGVRLKPLGHPSNHTDCGQLGSAPNSSAVLNGQGEIRTLDTGFTGMPVFETGAFNHSATCPAASQLTGRPILLQLFAV